MTLPRSAADALARHVTFELEGTDRVYGSLHVPKLQRDLGVAGFIREHLGTPVASPARRPGIPRHAARQGPQPGRRQPRRHRSHRRKPAIPTRKPRKLDPELKTTVTQAS
jgi:hypothetical protein